jgi:ABC-type polysaccharide/polyol phosphate export permease
MMPNPQIVIDWLLGLGPEMLLGLVLCGIGYTIKCIPRMDNSWIPLINLSVAVLVYPLLRQPGSAPFWAPYPIIYFSLVGFVIFFAEWILHNKLLKRIEDWLGLFDKQSAAKPPSE